MLSKLKDMFSTNYYNTNITKQYSSEPLVIRINEPITTKENERIDTTLRERGINAILIPSYMEVIQTKVNVKLDTTQYMKALEEVNNTQLQMKMTCEPQEE
ncbi:hypothetical protein FDF74_12190 [Clostridium niameyense]|uniref:Uncharacterized protein n=1 Tax=Clostridium niameyense TaxID=1622073 RepID=A0A6M0RCC0_9CLOT|nr:hypothetical protein [Clostridium niameyense]NEZ47941.1 hypothetical protein [Clostridium niameyense]